MRKAAIIYASHDGQTRNIATALSEQLQTAAVNVSLLKVESCNARTLNEYDVLIFAASIRYGKHLKPMVSYLSINRDAIKTKKTAFFSVNLTARKPNRNTAETSNYTKKLFKQLDWRPNEADVFAGKLDYPRYGFFDKHMIRFIMWLTNGPTDPKTVQEFTDWQRVEIFGERLIALCQVQ